MFKILISNVKGGVGKSTIAANLAHYFSETGRSTALVDLDCHGSSFRWVSGAHEPSGGESPSLHAEQFSAYRAQGGFRRALIELRRLLQQHSQNREILIADLTWTDHLEGDLLFEFDMVLMPTGLSEVELRTTLDFATQHEWVFRAQGVRPMLVVAPSRVREDQLTVVGQTFSRFNLPLVLTPPILESESARKAYGVQFLLDVEDSKIAESFKAFAASVDQAIQYQQQRQASLQPMGRTAPHATNAHLRSSLKMQLAVFRAQQSAGGQSGASRLNGVSTPHPTQNAPDLAAGQFRPTRDATAGAELTKTSEAPEEEPLEAAKMSFVPKFLRGWRSS